MKANSVVPRSVAMSAKFYARGRTRERWLWLGGVRAQKDGGDRVFASIGRTLPVAAGKGERFHEDAPTPRAIIIRSKIGLDVGHPPRRLVQRLREKQADFIYMG